MTYDNKTEALQAARALKRKMKTLGWKIRVHENLGWHCEIKRGGFTVWPSQRIGRRISYGCLLGTPGQGGGHGFWHDQKCPIIYDPNEAVERQLRVAIAFVRQCRREILDSLHKSEVCQIDAALTSPGR